MARTKLSAGLRRRYCELRRLGVGSVARPKCPFWSRLSVVDKMDKRQTPEYNKDLASIAFNYGRDNLVCLVGTLVTVMLASNIAGARHDMLDLRKTGGRGRCSTAIPALASWLVENSMNDPLITYNMNPTILYLTKGKVDVINSEDHEPGDFSILLEHLLSGGTDIYFVTAENINDYLNKKEFEEFLALASSCGRKISVVKVFNNRAGRPEFVLHKIAR